MDTGQICEMCAKYLTEMSHFLQVWRDGDKTK